MTLHFDYRAKPRSDGSFSPKMPLIPVLLRGPEGEFETLALLDSGADFSTLFPQQAQVLGVLPKKSEKTETVFGLGGKVDVSNTQLFIEFSGRGEHKRYRMQVPCFVIVEDKEEYADYPVILGRAGFFEKFRITFFELAQRIEMSEISYVP